MIKVIDRDYIELLPGEVVEEVTVSERILFWKIKRTYRNVHGSWFRFRKKSGNYEKVSWMSDISSYLEAKLPVDEN